MMNTMIQNFVNMTLPSPSTNSQPCTQYEACQASIIIMDSRSTDFVSTAKDAVPMSIQVDLSLQSTYLSTPDSLIDIQDIEVKGLTTPIQMTIPLTTMFTDTSGNTTLGCGYLDSGNMFKSDGIGIQMINRQLVTCLPYHLTSIGVEQYAVDQQALVASTTTVVIASNSSSSGQVNLQ